MKKKLLVFLLIFLTFSCASFSQKITTYAESEVESKLEQNVEDIVDAFDFSEYENIINELTNEQTNVFGEDSFKNKVLKLINGDYEISFTSVLSLVFSFYLSVSLKS